LRSHFFSADRNDLLNHRHNLLFALVVTVGVAFLGLTAIALICQQVIPPIQGGPAFDRQFTISEWFFYLNQPSKTAAYNLGCLALPFLLGLGFWCGNLWAKNLSSQTVDRLTWTGVVLYFLFVMGCAVPLFYCPHPPLPIVPPKWLLLPFDFSNPLFTLRRVVVLLVAGGFALFFVRLAPSSRAIHLPFILLLALWLVLIPTRFYTPSQIDDANRFTYHLNAVLDAVSQSANGHHWLVDFPHIYGGYGEMLAPIVRLFPRGIEVLIAVLAIPNVLSMFALLLTARLVIRNPALLWVCGLALLGIQYLASNTDLYYPYSTARGFFPPIGLLGAVLYFRNPSYLRYAAVTVLAALASIWNLDTGIVLWASWLVTLMVTQLAARNLGAMLRHLWIQVLSLVAAWTLCFLYLRMISGQWPHGGMIFIFQKLVVSSGYFCVPVIVPDLWMFVLSLYVIGLAVVLGLYLRGIPNWLTPVVLMTSLLGIGIFSYFMGRSAASNLVAVSYPAVLLSGILCEQVEDFSRRPGRLPDSARFFLLPAKLAVFWWAFLFLAALPDLLHTTAKVVRNWRNPEQTPFLRNAAFVMQRVKPQEEGVYFLSNHSGIYYYLTDTVRDLKMPGIVELLRTEDMDVLIDAIRERRIKKLFVERNFNSQMYSPEVYQEIQDAVDQNYREIETGPTGRLAVYVPRK
jgi:hypothetical protein